MDQSSEISANEMSAIRHQMDETRTALTEKLEKLEQKVTNTVQGAAQSVGDTVENVKHAVEDTVNTVKSSINDTVHAVGETVHAVGEAFSITHHVERHPWTMVAGATALGFVGGYLLFQRNEDARADEKFRHLAASQGRVPETRYEASPDLGSMPPNRSATSSTMHGMRESRSTNAFSEWLRPASSQIQSLVVGAALGLLRDMLVKSVPKPMTGQVTEIVNGLTSSLGGQVFRDSLFDQTPKTSKS